MKFRKMRRESPRQKFLYNLSRASYEKQWGKNYQRPTQGEKFLAVLYRLLPSSGRSECCNSARPHHKWKKCLRKALIPR